jgi:HEAT repeat protein
MGADQTMRDHLKPIVVSAAFLLATIAPVLNAQHDPPPPSGVGVGGGTPGYGGGVGGGNQNNPASSSHQPDCSGGTILPPLPPPPGGWGGTGGPFTPTGPNPAGVGTGRSSGGGGGRVVPRKAKQLHNNERYEAWDVWWELNDDAFLAARAEEHAKSHSKDSDSSLGAGEKLPVVKITDNDLVKDISPVLRRATKDTYLPVRRQAVVALGKTADASHTDVFQTIRALVGDPDWDMRAASCVGLGMLGAPDGVPLLVSMMKNDPSARAFAGIGTKDVSVKERSFAALGIGLVGLDNGLNPETIAELTAAMKAKTAHPDLRVFPALALGALRAYSAVPELKKLAFDSEAPEVVRAHAIVALGKLADKSSVSLLVREGLSDRSAHVQRSAAIALGLLGDREDQRTVEALVQAAKTASDRAVRNFAMIALGRIGHKAGRDFLVTELRGGNVADRTFSALGLGVLGARNPEARQDVGRALLAAFVESKSDGERAAFAVALGLVDHKPAIEPVVLALTSLKDPEIRGHFATAAGLLGARTAIPVLKEIIEKSQDGGLMMKASVALGLIGDPSLVKVVVKVFEESSNNMAALAGAALAIGFIGDRSAVAPLAKVLDTKDGSHDYARTYAALALGILGDKREKRTLAAIQESTNYLATTEYLSELLSTY